MFLTDTPSPQVTLNQSPPAVVNLNQPSVSCDEDNDEESADHIDESPTAVAHDISTADFIIMQSSFDCKF